MSSDGGSFGHLSVHVGDDWTVRCHAYDAHTPIFDIDAGRVALSVSVRDCDATDRAVEFARALAREAQVFAAEVERYHAMQHPAVEADGTNAEGGPAATGNAAVDGTPAAGPAAA